MSIHYSGKQALASGMVKQRLLQYFHAALLQVPQAAEIMNGKAGRISDDVLSWDIVATKHQHAKQQLSNSTEKQANKSKKDKSDKKQKKKDKKDKHGRQNKRHNKA